MDKPLRFYVIAAVGVVLCLVTLSEVNFPRLRPQSQLAVFAMLGLTLCFLNFPAHPRWKDRLPGKILDGILVALTVFCCGFVFVQTEPMFQQFWLDGQSLGHRAGQETRLDFFVGLIGLALVLEGTRRSIGLALPVLSLLFVAYALWGNHFPTWLFPHRGYSLERAVSQTFLQTQGVFGVALRVMFTYVFLFVIFGAFLKATGATQFIIDFARRVFRNSPGGPAKVSVLSSGLMGSLSGSAVANTATTGTFTIPMMKGSGYRPEVAGGVEAAASTGGALVPPVMGAAAYMMLEIVTPPVTYLQIIKAALIPAILYYLSLFLIVHFYSRRIGADSAMAEKVERSISSGSWFPYQGVIFAGAFLSLLFFLFQGYTAFRAVSLALVTILILSWIRKDTRLSARKIIEALAQSGRDVIPLIAAAACVGIIIGVVVLTGIGNKFPALILPLAEGSLFLALLLIMVSSIVLGMGLPSAVCYLLMATLIGPVLGNLGVPPLAAHFFIFYFGMMSMVTPPVALAAYAASSIAGSGIMQTALAGFRFALVGFTLPFMFVFRPELLMLAADGGTAPTGAVIYAVAVAVLGILAFAVGIVGFLFRPVRAGGRIAAFVAAALLLFPGTGAVWLILLHDGAGVLLLAFLAAGNWKAKPHEIEGVSRPKPPISRAKTP